MESGLTLQDSPQDSRAPRRVPAARAHVLMMANIPVELVVLCVLVASFALLITAHVALSVGLALRPPRWRGPLAFVVPPLAPWWGAQARMRLWSLIWVSSLAIYVVALVVALTAGQ